VLYLQHILIFFVAVLYVGNAVVASLSMEKTRAGWDRIANETLDDCLSGVTLHLERVDKSWIRKVVASIPTPSPGWREDSDYKILRFIFLR
jgi:hypothetical protein